MKKTKTNIPELRFPGFKGEWEEKKLGDGIKELQAGVSVNSIDTPVCIGEYGILKTSAVYNGIFDTTKNKRIIEEDLDKAKISPIPDNIIISRMNTPDLVGECGYVANSSENIFLPDRLWITSGVNRSLFNVKFINYTLNTPKNKLLIKNKATGTSNSMKNITKQDWLLTTIALPIISEQEKIASFLGAVDQKIEQLEKMVALQEKYKKGMMQRIFNQEIRFRSSNGTPFPAWQQKKLGDIGTFFSGGTPSTNIKEFWDGDINWFVPSEVGKTKFIYKSLRRITVKGLSNSSAKLLNKGAILLSTRATIGEKSILKTQGCTNQGFQSVLVNSVNSVDYVYYLLDVLKVEMIKRSSGSTFLEISSSNLKSIDIHIPILEEQEKIAGFLSALDEKIEQSKAELEKAKNWKKGLMQLLFV